MPITNCPAPAKWLTPKQFAEQAQLSPFTVWRLVRQGQLPAQHFGRSIRISTQVLDNFGCTGDES